MTTCILGYSVLGRMTIVRLANLIYFFIVLAISCSSKIVAEVSSKRITLAEFQSELATEVKKHDPADIDKIKGDLLERLVKEEILYQEAIRRGIEVTDEELNREYVRHKSQYTEALFKRMLELKGIDYERWKANVKKRLIIDKLLSQDVISNIAVGEDDIELYYKGHAKEFVIPEKVHARQIVVDDKQLAQELHNRLLAGENFAELARRYSIAPEGRRGGDLGFFEKGIYPPAFDRVCFKLAIGAISGVVETEFGYHIFKMIEKQKGRKLKPDEVRDKIITKIKQGRSGAAFDDWYNGLKEKTRVKVYNEVIE